MTTKSLRSFAARTKAKFRQLRSDSKGLALVEFAFTAPIVLGLGMLGTETAYYVITHLKVSQIAMQVADNASRVGEFDVLVDKKVYEDDITEVFVGAEKLGEGINIFDQGRIIVSSLEQNSTGGQWIHWQRCRGAKVHNSSYGVEGDGETGNDFEGMGDDGNKIKASGGTAVMFVEVSYTYQSLTPFDFLEGREIDYTAAFNIRNARDLTKLYGEDSGQEKRACNTYEA